MVACLSEYKVKARFGRCQKGNGTGGGSGKHGRTRN